MKRRYIILFSLLFLAANEPIHIDTKSHLVFPPSPSVSAPADFDFTGRTVRGLVTGPGGSNTQVQYNNSSVFGGITNSTTDGTTETLTSPKIVTTIKDTNANTLLGITATASAVNDINLANAATGGDPILASEGNDGVVNLQLKSKGSGGKLKINQTTTPTSLSSSLQIFGFDDGIGDIATDFSSLAATGIRLYGGTAYATGPAFQIWPTGSSLGGMYFDAGNASGADIHFRKAPAGTDALTIKQGTGAIIVTPSARSSGSASYWTLNIPPDTAQTAATESIGYQHVTATRQWATTGTVALQRENFFAGPTYSSASASQTFTDAFTLYATPPIAGTNAIFTRDHTFGIVDSTSAASSITGGLVVATTLGTSATSVGVGGGNINAGGTITSGSTINAVTGYQLNATEFPIAANGIVKRTAANTYSAATAKTDYWDTTDLVASGASHAHGLAPDPGSTAGTTRFLREDAAWAVPSGSAAGSWDGTAKVSGSDATTTGQTLVDITGLVTPTLLNSTLYEIEVVILIVSSDANGNQYGIHSAGTGTAATCAVVGAITGNGSANTASVIGYNQVDVAANTYNVTTPGSLVLKGFVTTTSTGTPTISIQHLKVTSGTSTVKIGSTLKWRKA